ncbi:alcohol dehydrogenase catalytic domain-containing protein [Xenorhabdus thailandensis]|uniref:alcohol dehydrogenase catalytic domain-containing protein n=1 Tax=Xenorhabdus thailandensis TaxID=3136255 RepID=UPI0030F48B2E
MVELSNGTVKCITKNFPRQILSDDTLVIRLDYMGVCRTAIKEIIGSRDILIDRGSLFGHEFVGIMFFAGISTGYQEGEPVTFNPNITPNRTAGFVEYVFVHGLEDVLEQAIIRVTEI